MGFADKLANAKKSEHAGQESKKFSIIESDIDKIYKIAIVFRKISVKDAAKKIGISTDKAEELARILEKKGLVGLNYKLSGGLYLKWQEKQ